MFEISFSISGGVPFYRRHNGGIIVVECRMECGRVERRLISGRPISRSLKIPKQLLLRGTNMCDSYE
jgi:hypothetical protein